MNTSFFLQFNISLLGIKLCCSNSFFKNNFKFSDFISKYTLYNIYARVKHAYYDFQFEQFILLYFLNPEHNREVV